MAAWAGTFEPLLVVMVTSLNKEEPMRLWRSEVSLAMPVSVQATGVTRSEDFCRQREGRHFISNTPMRSHPPLRNVEMRLDTSRF